MWSLIVAVSAFAAAAASAPLPSPPFRHRAAPAVTPARQLSAAAVAAVRERAAAGSRDDNYVAGLLYTYGESVPRDTQKALRHFRAAASAGHVGALVAAGALLEDDDAPDARAAALELYRRAGRAGDAEAQYRAARLLHATVGEGDAVVALLRDAVGRGHAAAHWLLAAMLESGWRGAFANEVRRSVEGAHGGL